MEELDSDLPLKDAPELWVGTQCSPAQGLSRWAPSVSGSSLQALLSQVLRARVRTMPGGLEHSPGKRRDTVACAGMKHDTLVLSKVSVTRITVWYKFDNIDHLGKTVRGDGCMCLRCHYTFFHSIHSSKGLLQDHIWIKQRWLLLFEGSSEEFWETRQEHVQVYWEKWKIARH